MNPENTDQGADPLQLAKAAFAAARHAEAEELCTAILSKQPRHWPFYPIIALVLIAAGRPADADRLTEHVLGQVPEQPEVLLARAHVLEQIGRTSEALNMLDRAVDLRLTWREATDQLDALLAREADPRPRYPVTVVTPTMGTPHLQQSIESVQKQTYPFVRHLLVIDRGDYRQRVESKVPKCLNHPIDVLRLPASTGGRGFNGHRVYGAAPFLVESRFLAFLDEDNWFAPNHLEMLMAGITSKGASWGFSLRRIVDEEGLFLMDDNCESLGPVPTWIHASVNLVDTNCYVLRRDVALDTNIIWYRRAPDETSPDFVLCKRLLTERPRYVATGRPTVNYRLRGPQAAGRAEFFRRGNAEMLRHHGSPLPWRAAEAAPHP